MYLELKTRPARQTRLNPAQSVLDEKFASRDAVLKDEFWDFPQFCLREFVQTRWVWAL